MTNPPTKPQPVPVIPLERYKGEILMENQVQLAQISYYTSGTWFYRIGTFLMIVLIIVLSVLCLISVVVPMLLGGLLDQIFKGMDLSY